MPKGTRADRIDAEKYLIEQIKNDKNMPPLAKAAAVSQIRKILKEYTVQNDIVNLTIEQLGKDSNPSGIKDEWIMDFFDKCKDSEESVKSIWASILLKECNDNGSVPKRLLNMLSCITQKEAMAFNNLCRFCVTINNEKLLWVKLRDFGGQVDHFYEDNGLNFMDVDLLRSIGLIMVRKSGQYGFKNSGDVTIKIVDFEMRVLGTNDGIPIGNLIFTDEGQILADLLQFESVKGFAEYVKWYLESAYFKVEILKNIKI
ncbi:MAG: DUF2806 domain-containing protein [Eubacteriales bacterium]|nr:DUF2806 domain-containing protein [Eubacteriales bacterium]